MLVLMASLTSSPNFIIEDAACSELVEINKNSKNTISVLRNREKIPAVDVQGKMLFYLQVEKIKDDISLIIDPAKDCKFRPQTNLTITFTDNTQFTLKSKQSQPCDDVRVPIPSHILSSIVSRQVLSIDFESMKTDYDVIIKPQQSNALRNVLECVAQ